MFSITNREQCEVILVKVQCVTVKLLTLFLINNHKNMPKHYFQNKCCSITAESSVLKGFW